MKGRYQDENLKWIPALIALVILLPFILKGMTFSYKYYLYILNTIGIYIILTVGLDILSVVDLHEDFANLLTDFQPWIEPAQIQCFRLL